MRARGCILSLRYRRSSPGKLTPNAALCTARDDEWRHNMAHLRHGRSVCRRCALWVHSVAAPQSRYPRSTQRVFQRQLLVLHCSRRCVRDLSERGSGGAAPRCAPSSRSHSHPDTRGQGWGRDEQCCAAAQPALGKAPQIDGLEYCSRTLLQVI